jgi:hypothetical protein
MMPLIRGLIAVSRPFSMRMTPCELNGSLIGAITGLLFALAWMAGKEADPSFVPVAFPLWLQMALLLALFCWCALFVLLCGPLRYAPSAVAAPLLVNAVLTSVLTVYLCNLIGQPLLFFAIGIAVGFLVGWLLCRSCRRPTHSANDNRKEG